MALTLHAEQRRKGTDIPYIAHLLSVAALVLEHGGDEDLAIAGLLHDAVEDCGAEQEAAIAARFGPRVAAVVRDCTDADTFPKPPWQARKQAYLDHFKTWPPFLLDLLPQGHARKVLAEALRLNQDAAACDAPLLLRAAGDPIGNIRIKQAWDAERKRVKQAPTHPGLPLDELFERGDAFNEFARDYAAVASGSSGVQGAWPKLLMTRNKAGRWLPDPMVPDDQAAGHAIIKWVGDKDKATRLILAAEAPYLELARAFGVRCAQPLEHRGGTLFIPRFDREVVGGRVVRLGQESIVSAAGVAAFGYQASHEEYLDAIKAYCDDPAAEVTEYVLRDVLNLGLGNPDNHGRNTALQKTADGGVRLTPLYDFCPMRLDSSGIARSTTWKCMRPFNGPSRDLNPDWEKVCRVAADGVPGLDAEDLMDTLAGKADCLRRMPELARGIGVPDAVIAGAMGFCGQHADALEALSRRRTHAPR